MVGISTSKFVLLRYWGLVRTSVRFGSLRCVQVGHRGRSIPQAQADFGEMGGAHARAFGMPSCLSGRVGLLEGCAGGRERALGAQHSAKHKGLTPARRNHCGRLA